MLLIWTQSFIVKLENVIVLQQKINECTIFSNGWYVLMIDVAFFTIVQLKASWTLFKEWADKMIETNSLKMNVIVLIYC